MLGAGHHLRPSDAHVVDQHVVGCSRRTLRALANGRSEHGRCDNAESLRPRDGHLQRRSAIIGELDTHSHHRQGDAQSLPARVFGGDHQWKIGAQVEKGEHTSRKSSPPASGSSTTTGSRFRRSPAPLPSRRPVHHGGGIRQRRPDDADRLTINAGMRFDHSRAISQDLHAIDAKGAKRTAIVRGLGTLYTWNILSPRLGMTAKLTADGRTMLRASYGRFSQGVLTGELGPIHPGVTPITTTAVRSEHRRLHAASSRWSIRESTCCSIPTRARHARTSIDRRRSRDRAPAGRGARLRPQDGSDFIAWTDVGGQYREETRTLPDGRSLPVFVLANSTADPALSPDQSRWILADIQRSCDGSRETPVERLAGLRLLHTVQNITGCRYPAARPPPVRRSAPSPPPRPRHSGAIRTTSPTRTAGCRTIARTCSASWARRRATDRLRARGQSAVLQRQAVGGDGAGCAATGRPAHPARAARLAPAVVAVAARPARVEDRFGFGSMGRVELLVDVLNVLNDTAEEGLATDNLFSPNFRPTYRVHGSATRDGQREAESGPMNR